ncbi:MAG: glutathione transport system substrate-binding protein [Pseudonocardiales bacterium]|nr:glutathione transport system substrate-binding protein [Pseudonocardiales bacterium]
MVLTSCGWGGGAAVNGRDRAVARTDINPLPRDQVRDGGDLRLPLLAMPNNYNYNQVDGRHVDVLALAGAVLPGLFRATADGGLAGNPDYLAAAEMTSTAPQVVTYTLNPRATWTDGTPITWRDFAAYWHSSSGTDPAFRAAGTTGYDAISSVTRGVDDRQAVITFDRRYAEWRNLFNPFLPAALTSTAQAFNTAWRTSLPVSAGPFAVDTIDPVAKTITLARNPRWWGNRPKLDRIIFKVYEPSATPDALANNELDFYKIGPNVDLLRRAEQTPGAAVRRAPSRYYTQVGFNAAPGAPLADPQLRVAVAQSIDRAGITRRMLGQIEPHGSPDGNHLYAPGTAAYRDNSDALPYDPAHAQQVLESLGFARAGDGRQRGGTPLRLRLIYGDAPSYQDIATAVREQLERVGISIDPRQYPSNEIFPNLAGGNFDLALFSWYGTASPLSDSMDIYRGPVGDNPRLNFGRVSNAELEALFTQGIAEPDEARRAAIGNQIDRLIWQEAHSVILYAWPGAVAVRANLANFGAFGFADADYLNAGFAL